LRSAWFDDLHSQFIGIDVVYVFAVTLQMSFAGESLLAEPTFELLLLLTLVLQVFVQAGFMFVIVAALGTTVARIRDNER